MSSFPHPQYTAAELAIMKALCIFDHSIRLLTPNPQIGYHSLYIPLFSFHPHTSCSSVLYMCFPYAYVLVGWMISNPSYALPCANLALLNYITHSTLAFFSQFSLPQQSWLFPLLFDSEAYTQPHVMATETI